MEEVDEVEARKRSMVAEARRRARWPSRMLIGCAGLWSLGAVGLYALAKVQDSQLMALVAIGLLGPSALVGLGGWLLRRLRGWNVVWAGLLLGATLWVFAMVLAVLEQVGGVPWLGGPLALLGLGLVVYLATFGEDGHVRGARHLIAPRGPVDPVDRMPF